MEHPADALKFGAVTPTPPPVSLPGVKPWRSVLKAITWRVIGSTDTLILSFLSITYLGPLLGLNTGASTGDNLETASFIAITEVLTKMVLYVVHERLWERVRWDVSIDELAVRREGVRRSGVKTGTWRVLASLDTFLLALFFTGNVGTALSIGGFEIITKLVLYFFHERAWARIRLGLIPAA